MYKVKRLLICWTLALSTIPLSASAGKKISIGSNMLGYLSLITPNIEVGVSLARHWSLQMGGKYNPFYWDVAGRSFQLNQMTASVGATYWPWFVFSGWHYGASLQYSQYNRGGIISSQTEEGNAYGLSLYGGYSLLLNKWMNLEFGLGVWGGITEYKTYDAPRCGKLIGEGQKFFIMPDDINISIVFIF